MKASKYLSIPLFRRYPWDRGKCNLQSSSKILKHLGAFSFPQCWFVHYSGLSASKYAWLNIGEGEGTLQWEQKCEEWKFKRTVSVSTICDEYCSQDDSIVPISCPRGSEDVVIILNLSQQQLWFVLTLLAARVTNINFLLTISTYF